MEDRMRLNVVGNVILIACKQKEGLFPPSSTLMNHPPSLFLAVRLFVNDGFQ